MNIRELADAVGETPRQIRHLIAEGIIAGPAGSRTSPVYSQAHADEVRRYQALRRILRPSEIKALVYTELVGREFQPIVLAPGVLLTIDPGAVRPGLDARTVGELAEAVVSQFTALPHPKEK